MAAALRVTSWNIENLAPYLSAEGEPLRALLDGLHSPDGLCVQEVRAARKTPR